MRTFKVIAGIGMLFAAWALLLATLLLLLGAMVAGDTHAFELEIGPAILFVLFYGVMSAFGLVLIPKNLRRPSVLIPIALAATIVGIAIPNVFKARSTTAMNPCINNQRLIESAIQQYALEEEVAAGAPIPSEDIIGSYIKGGMPRCPKDGARYQVSGTVDDARVVCPNGHNPLYPGAENR